MNWPINQSIKSCNGAEIAKALDFSVWSPGTFIARIAPFFSQAIYIDVSVYFMWHFWLVIRKIRTYFPINCGNVHCSVSCPSVPRSCFPTRLTCCFIMPRKFCHSFRHCGPMTGMSCFHIVRPKMRCVLTCLEVMRWLLDWHTGYNCVAVHWLIDWLIDLSVYWVWLPGSFLTKFLYRSFFVLFWYSVENSSVCFSFWSIFRYVVLPALAPVTVIVRLGRLWNGWSTFLCSSCFCVAHMLAP